MYGSDADPMIEPWRCWRCNSLHARKHARCPNAGVNEGAATYAERQARLDAFLARQNPNPEGPDTGKERST